MRLRCHLLSLPPCVFPPVWIHLYAIVSAATCALSSPASPVRSSAAPIICITWQIQRARRCFACEHVRLLCVALWLHPPRVQKQRQQQQACECIMLVCALALAVHPPSFFLSPFLSFFFVFAVIEWECWRHLDGSQTLARVLSDAEMAAVDQRNSYMCV